MENAPLTLTRLFAFALLGSPQEFCDVMNGHGRPRKLMDLVSTESPDSLPLTTVWACDWCSARVTVVAAEPPDARYREPCPWCSPAVWGQVEGERSYVHPDGHEVEAP